MPTAHCVRPRRPPAALALAAATALCGCAHVSPPPAATSVTDTARPPQAPPRVTEALIVDAFAAEELRVVVPDNRAPGTPVDGDTALFWLGQPLTRPATGVDAPLLCIAAAQTRWNPEAGTVDAPLRSLACWTPDGRVITSNKPRGQVTSDRHTLPATPVAERPGVYRVPPHTATRIRFDALPRLTP